MSFQNVELKKKANIYHEGRVTSRTFLTPEGERKTLGFMLPGSYRFDTDEPEKVDITQGHCRVKIADEWVWKEYHEGESFFIPGKITFEIQVDTMLDYVCHFG